MKEKIIEIVENILYEYGWIIRPHGDETDDILNDIKASLPKEIAEQGEQRKSAEEIKTDIAIIVESYFHDAVGYDILGLIDELYEYAESYSNQKMREKMIKFYEWAWNNDKINEPIDTDELVDEYLKSNQ